MRWKVGDQNPGGAAPGVRDGGDHGYAGGGGEGEEVAGYEVQG